MIITELIEFLTEYKTDSKYTFYKDALNKLIKLKEELDKTNTKINRIQQKSYLLEPLRIYLITGKYNIFLSNKKHKDCNYIKYTLTDKEKNNFLSLVVLTEELNSDILKFREIDITNISKILNDKNIYLNFTKSNLDNKNIYEIKNLYDSLSFLLGIESINILKYLFA